MLATALLSGCVGKIGGTGEASLDTANPSAEDGDGGPSAVDGHDRPDGAGNLPDAENLPDPDAATNLPDAAGSPPNDPDPDAGNTASCPAGDLANRIGVEHLLVGGSIDDAEFAEAPFDLRYHYLASDAPTGGPCESCASGCSTDDWWGCWQSDRDPPGQYVLSRIAAAEAAGALPMITYYTWSTVAGNVEDAAEIAALADGPRVARYLADWRFACQKTAEASSGPVFLHVEPDLWGFGHRVNSDPEAIVAAVSAAESVECADLPDSMAGLARCMLAIARAEAPAALVGFHASGWGAGHDALHEDDPDFDVLGHAAETASFMTALGATQADLVVVEMSDRDAGMDGRWWDPSNAELPHFDRAMRWASRVANNMGLPFLWWQVPLGNMELPDGCQTYRDNRVDYIFDHAHDFAADGALGIAFGAGSSSCGTTAATDGGHFLARANAHFEGDRPCVCGACP